MEHEDVDKFEVKAVSDGLQWHDNNIHKQEWKHSFEHHPRRDFVEMVHIIFMNHLGIKIAIIMLLLICCISYHSNLTAKF